MQHAHIERELGAAETHGHQDAALSARARLAAHPARFHRMWGPDHQDGGRILEFRGDLVVEILAGGDLRIPPDRPALRLDRRDQRRDERLVAAGVGNEDVGHACSRMPNGNHIHGLNERMRVKSLMEGRRFLFEVVKLYADGK